ncbi:hypothetical protein B7463_g9575, partial [Scytalidium lignicola]
MQALRDLCDRGKPECQRCFTTGRKCSGYEQDFNFVVTTSSNWPHQPSCPRHAALGKETGSKDQARFQTARNCPFCSRDPAQPGPPTLYKIPDQKAISCELFTRVFMDLFLPRNQVTDSMTALPGGWICLLPTLFHGRNEVLNKSLLALYTGFVGRKTGDARLASRGTELYIDALQALRQSEIWSSQRGNNDIDAQLATTMVFSRCELLLAEGAGYMHHVRGGLQLIKRFASRLPSSELSKLLVKKFRCLGYYEAVRHRKAFFMAYPPYNKLYPAVPSDSDYLIQRGFECTAWMTTIMEQADKLDAMSCSTEKAARRGQRAAADLLRFALKLDQNAAAWYSEICHTLKPPTHVHLETSGGRISFPRERLIYANPGDSYVWMLYWSIYLNLGQLIKQIQARYHSLAKLLPDPIPLTRELAEFGADYSTLDQYAENVAASLFSGFEPSLFTSQEITVSVFAAVLYYGQRGEAEKAHWLIKVLKTIESQGLTMSLQVMEGPSHAPTVQADFLADGEIAARRPETTSPPQNLVEMLENISPSVD